jgi:putative nucleotidyltransferase with HDIG domain
VPIKGTLVPRLKRIVSVVFVPATVVAGAAICAYSGWSLFSSPVPMEWLVLLVLTVGAGLATLRVPAMPISFAISDTFTILSALLVGPAAGALSAALDGLVLSFRMVQSRREIARVLFNMACLSIATWVAGEVFFSLAGADPVHEGPLGALRLLGSMAVFGALHFALNSGLVATAGAVDCRGSIIEIWRKHFSGLWLSSFGGTFAAMLMLVLARESAIEIVILIAPLPVLLYVALRHALGRAADQIDHLGKMNRVYVATIEALAQAVDAKDQVTHDHVRRVQEKSLRLAERLGVVDDGQLQALKAAGLLHDVGKIGIPEHILNKPGRLTPSEFEIMKRHPAIGADILSVIGFPYPLIPIVRHHHENWDGTGYPDGLTGEGIPIGARILQVVDCFDALTSDRPYRRAMSEADAMKIVTDRSGTMYDPRVVSALVELHAHEQASRVHQAPAGNTEAREALRRCDPVVRGSATSALVPAETALPEPSADVPRAPVDESRTLAEIAADLGASVSTHHSPALVGEAVWNSVREHVPASAFVLFTCDAQTTLVPACRFGERTVAPHTRIAVGERLSGWVAATRRSIVNSDARLDFDSDVQDTTALRAALAVPLHRGGETLGVLAFYSDRQDAFGETHQRLAEVAAYVAANALQPPAAPVAVAS